MTTGTSEEKRYYTLVLEQWDALRLVYSLFNLPLVGAGGSHEDTILKGRE